MQEKKLIHRVIAFWIFVVAIFVWLFLIFWTPNFKFGLDLNGGTSLTYIADVSKIQNLNKQSDLNAPISSTTGQKILTLENSKVDIDGAMNVLRDVIEKRVNNFGVAESIVRTEYSRYTDEYRLVIELPGISDLNKAIATIGDTPKLEFKLLEKTGEGEFASTTFINTGLTGEYLKKAVLTYDNLGKPSVLINFNDTGRDLFANLTKANIGKQIAIILDGNVVSAPTVQDAITTGQATISGNFKAKEAKDLVERLNSGALPLPIKLISSQIVEATLGQQAKEAGIYSGIFGLIIIIILMILWYRLPGLLASISLLTYIGIVLLIFKLIPVVLTAAGMAGFIISIGVAIDANILIFERLKEELKNGKNINEAVEESFKRAWSSIKDSNIASILVALVLYYFGSTLLKGFGLVFGIGILVSIFSSMIISKYFIRAFSPKSGEKIVKWKKFFFNSGFNK